MLHYRTSLLVKPFLLLEINIQSPVEDAVQAHVLFVGKDRCVEGNERDVVALGPERGSQSIVADAIAAIHAAGAGRDVRNSHDSESRL